MKLKYILCDKIINCDASIEITTFYTKLSKYFV